MTTSVDPIQSVAESTWLARRQAHQQRVDDLLVDHRERRSRGAAHPVEDFLFDYYSFRPAQLRRWHPGAGVVLSGESATDYLAIRDYVGNPSGVALDVDTVLAARGTTVRWVLELLQRTAARPGFFGCFGLHEWAMVYREAPEDVRHPNWPLRLSADGVAAVVEERGVRCGHFDAFRFFTPSARPLNVLQPTRADQPALEQPGCLHANMDLYKFAYKLSPLISSELVVDCFVLTRDIRQLDMRASPYDLSGLGLQPVRIETPEGRAAYAAAQRGFTDRSRPLRQALIERLEVLAARLKPEATPRSDGIVPGLTGNIPSTLGPVSRSAPV